MPRAAAAGNMIGRRPYFWRADWMWGAIPANPTLDPNSATIANALATGSGGRTVNCVDFGVVLRGPSGITASTPRYDIGFSNVPAWGPDPFGTDTMPIPNGTPVPVGSDAHIAIADPIRNRVYSLWQASHPNSSTWNASWGATSPLGGQGQDDTAGSSTGSGLARFAGVVRVAEIQAGRIDHALFFATNMVTPNSSAYRYPAWKTDGALFGDGDPVTIDEGTRVQLNPAVNLAAISGITPLELAVGKALQTYGAYCGDNGGSRMGFIFELASDAVDGDNPGAAYTAAGVEWDYWDMTHIPWSQLRVLKSWDGGAGPTPKMATLVDTFGSANSTLWWGYGGNVTVTTGAMQIVPSAAYPSNGTSETYDLTSSHFTWRFLQAPNVGNGSTEAVVRLAVNGTNYLSFAWGNNTLYAQRTVSGTTTTVASAAYSATNHAWLRISESGGAVTWARSANGTSWTTFATWTSTLTLTAVTAEFEAGFWGTEPSPGVFRIDNVGGP